MYVIGTAGHVDHGKSTLVQALTGIDPDRLREEKERGLTIDLGFAWFTSPGGEEVSIVDVPGHERFIKNMLAGVGGIDLALLVIAADEGVMPQTREHLAIIDLLGISHGVVALTKCDLVEEDLAELAQADVEEALAGTSLAGAPVVLCSGATRQGLDDLLGAIDRELEKTPAKRDIGRPRLPVDRVFTMTGFGTVVTGTLIDGALETGQEVELIPGGPKARIRGLQSHGRKVEVAPPGRRTAVNLGGVAVEELRRGMVLTTPGWLKPTDAVDVRLRATRHAVRTVRHNLPVTLHTGAAETAGRLLLLDREELPPGEAGWAQVRLDEPLAVVKGDGFIIRDPNDTLGGGRIVDTQARRHRRFHGPTLAALELLERGSPDELVLAALGRIEPADLRSLVRASDVDASTARESVLRLAASGEIVSLGGELITENSPLATRSGSEALTGRLTSALAAFHKQAPLRRGMPREELRSRLGLASRVFDTVVADLVRRDEVKEATENVALAQHEPKLDASQEARTASYLEALRSSPFSPPSDAKLEEGLLAYLESRGEIVRAGDGVVFDAQAHREMAALVTEHLRQHGTITLAQTRDMLSTSRKYAQALLEHMDSQHLTRRVGDERVLR